jgi:hypothetical protein
MGKHIPECPDTIVAALPENLDLIGEEGLKKWLEFQEIGTRRCE